MGQLTPDDLKTRPVWRYVNADEADETLVTPISRVPVRSLSGKIVGAQVRFSDNEIFWALIGNADANNSRLNEHLLTLSLWSTNKWIHLARYHDFDYDEAGPEALARHIGRRIDDIFPISFDIRKYVIGSADALCNAISGEPRERLSQSELMSLVLDS